MKFNQSNYNSNCVIYQFSVTVDLLDNQICQQHSVIDISAYKGGKFNVKESCRS